MRTSGEILGLSVILLAISACGGGVGDIGNDAGGGGDHGDGGPADETGTIGSSSCPPSSQIEDGFACNVSGATCSSGTPVYDCSGRPVVTPQCTCDQASWVCEQFVTGPCPSPPPTGCPDPSTVFPGKGCDGTINQACVSTNVPTYGCDGGLIPNMAECVCAGNAWQCKGGGTSPCAEPPPPTCPDPASIFPGAECNGDGLVCRGNPQDCGGQTFYDVLQCAGSWTPLATTNCVQAFDAGPVQDAAPIQDAPAIIDTF